MNANPFNLAIGLQLYTLNEEMNAAPRATLEHVAAAGYREVELSPMSNVPAKDLRKMLDDLGITNPSGQYFLPDLLNNLTEKIDFAKLLGQEYMIVTVPWVADPARFPTKPGEEGMEFFIGILNQLTLDDWRWNAEQFNKVGEKTKKAGLQLGYHNHNFDFKPQGSTTGYEELLRLTEPDLVKLELDCGWMVVAGRDPVSYLDKYPERYRLLHVKEFRTGFTPSTKLFDKCPGAPIPTQLGEGNIDYSKILSLAKNLKIRAMFVEQEPPFTEMPALQAIQVGYDYIKKLSY